HTGRSLMERTTIICNTSNMPVAAREASVYTAMTLCEYYRAMGLKVLLLADSTPRWAQALREMSNHMEELPGADAFPVDLSAIISNFYARAGMVYLNNGQTGSVTFIGTVSPAGGNLKEPVTESTKKAARCFYALEQNRADKKRYPSVNPIDSYSKYLEYPEIREHLAEKIMPGWVEMVEKTKNIIRKGRDAQEQINILGDDGVPLTYHQMFWKAELVDFVILQQDAFDAIDALCPLERQKYMLCMVLGVCDLDLEFNDFEECRNFFKEIINKFRQMNYSEFKSEAFMNYENEIKNMISNGK
ncbi:MAG: V-type ATP synthase subunit A, partial [Bacteroidales bacterium]|nr:V-type ATP synthase subunit A [Candidatus Cryptobacteroides caccocaballi]